MKRCAAPGCRNRVEQPRTGRRRSTCSDACRMRLSRKRSRRPRGTLEVLLSSKSVEWATDPAVFINVVAQGNSDSIGCRISIDGVVKDERTVNTMNAYAYCLDKSG